MLALKPKVVDALFAAFESFMPERPEVMHPLGCHRPRTVMCLRRFWFGW